jgi:FlaG protein
MDVSGVTRPLPVAAPQPLAANVGAQPTAVKTILPTAATVTATDNSQAPRFDSKRSNPNAALDEATRQAIERHLVIDRETKSLVLKVTEEPSGKVVRQIPDEVILKLRAYVRELTSKRAPESDTPRVEKVA